jgi:hypothetical protein
MPCLTFKKNCNNSKHIKQQLVVEKGGKERDGWIGPKTSQIQRIIYKGFNYIHCDS